MQEQNDRYEDCSTRAEQILYMRRVMSTLTRERIALGDTDPIVVTINV
jgi:hypothetical protein